jgi:hypothetical protein
MSAKKGLNIISVPNATILTGYGHHFTFLSIGLEEMGTGDDTQDDSPSSSRDFKPTILVQGVCRPRIQSDISTPLQDKRRSRSMG